MPSKSILSRHPLRVVVSFVALLYLDGPVSRAAPPERVDVIIQFRDPPAAREKNLVRDNGGSVKRTFRIVNAVSASIPAAAAERIRKAPGVLAVEADGKITAHDIGRTWGVKRIGAGAVHEGTFGENVAPVLGTGVKVAIVDSGIDYNHPELRSNYAGGYDFANNDSDPYDDDGHGTHVAGTVAALRNGSEVVGAAPEIALYGVKVLDADGSGSWSWIIAGLDWCVDNNIAVANFSLGSSNYPGTTVKNAFNNAAAAGLLVIASAGNEGEGPDTVGYPARFGSVVAVASTTSADKRSSFSSTGPSVELAAPGSSIYSTLPGGGFGSMSGTSMAAPHVSGAAALVVGAGVADDNGDGRINDDVRAILQASAEDLGAAGVDDHFGYGLVDAGYAALLAYDPNAPEPSEILLKSRTPFRVDGLIGKSRKRMIGDDVYANSSRKQIVRRKARSRGPFKWHARFENDGGSAGDVYMSGKRGNRLYRVVYRRKVNGAFTNATSALRSGFVETLQGGQGTDYRATVRVRKPALGRRKNFRLHLRGVSTGDWTAERVNGLLRNRTRSPAP